MSNVLHDLSVNGFPADRAKPCFMLRDSRNVSYEALSTGAAYVAGRLIAEGVQPGDRIIIFTYAAYREDELEGFTPAIVHVDEKNRLLAG